MAVDNNRTANKYSILRLTWLFFTNFLIPAPNAAHGEMDIGHITKAITAIKEIDKSKFFSAVKKLEAAMLEIDQALGFTIWNKAAS